MIQSDTLALLEWQRLCQHLSTFAATKLGSLAAQNINPAKIKAESLQLLAQTEEIYDLEERLEKGLSFEGIEDIGNALERAQRQGLLTGEELLFIATTLAGVRRLRRFIDEQEEMPVITALVSQVRTYPELEQEIHRCIDERGTVANRASQKLEGIRHQMKGVRDRVYEKLQNIMQQKSFAIQQQTVTQRGDRFVIPVKAPQKEAIRGIVHDTSSKGSTLFIEPHSVVDLGNQLRQLQRAEQAEEEAIRRKLTEQVAEVKEDLEHLLAIAIKIDLASARARYSKWLEASPPKFVNPDQGENITLRELVHPLLVWQHHHEDGAAVVPINVQIQPDIRVVAITGPNTGGKTVTLKTLGLAALMAKVGLFVSAKAPVELPWFEWVLADIGDEQSLEQSLSTFSSHITRISRILGTIGASEASLAPALVLLDEVGAGTDPAEGSALAESLLRFLRDRALLTIATTHYGELKALKYQDQGFENASVEFDEETLQPTYRLLWGIPGRSNALTIAKRLGLPETIITSAQERVGGFSEDINQVIAGLESQRKRQEDKAEEAKQLLHRTEKFYQEVSERAANLKEQEQNLKQSQEQQVNAEIAQAKAEIAKVIRQLQRGKQTAQKAQQATESLNKIGTEHLPPAQVKKPPKGYTPKLGEKVRIPRLNQTAEIIALPENGEVMVRFGIMKMTVPLGDIESLDGQKPEFAVKAKAAKTPAKNAPINLAPPQLEIRTSRNTLDLRGARVADAERQIDSAIATASAEDFHTLWIIHGKGTGKLRQGVQEFLQQHPQVKGFELAEQKEGGTGVTITTLV